MCIWMFSITLSHFEKNYMIFFFLYDGAINLLGKNSFKFSFVGDGLMAKSLGAWVHIWGGGTKKIKISKDEYEYFLQPN
jgi:hypothetical protein